MNSKLIFFIIVFVGIAGVLGYSVGHESFYQEKTPLTVSIEPTPNSTMNETGVSNTEIKIIHENGVQLVKYEETFYYEEYTEETTEIYEENGTENPEEYFTGDESGNNPEDFNQDQEGAELEKNYYENGNPEYN